MKRFKIVDGFGTERIVPEESLEHFQNTAKESMEIAIKAGIPKAQAQKYLIEMIKEIEYQKD